MSDIQSQIRKATAAAAEYELLGALANEPGKRANCQALSAFHKGLAGELCRKLGKQLQDSPNEDNSMPRVFPERRTSRLTRWHYGGMVLGYAALAALFFWFTLDRGSTPIDTKPMPNVTTGIAPADQSGIPHPPERDPGMEARKQQ